MGFERIVMHAISRDAATGARPCIFAQVERPAAPGGVAGDEEDAGEDEDEEELLSCTELRLVPSDEAACAFPLTTRCTLRTAFADAQCVTPAVNSLFRTMCDVAALNPDPRGEEGACHSPPSAAPSARASEHCTARG